MRKKRQNKTKQKRTKTQKVSNIYSKYIQTLTLNEIYIYLAQCNMNTE